MSVPNADTGGRPSLAPLFVLSKPPLKSRPFNRLLLSLFFFIVMVEAAGLVINPSGVWLDALVRVAIMWIGVALLIVRLAPRQQAERDAVMFRPPSPFAPDWESLSRICENAGIALVAEPTDGEPGLWNEAAARLIAGGDAGAVEDTPAVAVVNSLYPQIRQYRAATLSGEDSPTFEAELERSDGQHVPVMVTLVPLAPNAESEPRLAFLLVGLESQFEAIENEFEYVPAVDAAAVRNFTHAVRQPLTMLVGLLELQLYRPPSDVEQTSKRLRMMDDAARTIVEKVRSLESTLRLPPTSGAGRAA